MLLEQHSLQLHTCNWLLRKLKYFIKPNLQFIICFNICWLYSTIVATTALFMMAVMNWLCKYSFQDLKLINLDNLWISNLTSYCDQYHGQIGVNTGSCCNSSTCNGSPLNGSGLSCYTDGVSHSCQYADHCYVIYR